MARPRVGDRLAGRYQVRALATGGSTGMLFRGYDEQIGVEVALRIIDDDLLADESERRSFVQKATRAKTLQHPNLIRLYDILVDDAAVFLVMQWAPGERLSQRLASGPFLPITEGRSILRRVAAGIAHAHQHGVVIGNLRADSIILYPDGLKLTNVGVGPALPRARFLKAMSDRGVLLELSPELRASGEPDERADVFSLARLARKLLDELLPDAAEAVLARGLADDAATRPRDIEAFVRELEMALDGRGNERPPAVPTGYDTERVDRLPALPVEDGFTRPDAKADVLVEPTEDRTREPTVGSGRNSRIVELSADDLVEAALGPDAGEGMTRPLPKAEPSPDVTDVGRRSPVRIEQSVSEPLPTAPVAALPQIEKRIEAHVDRAPAVEDIPMLRSRPRAFDHEEEDDATRPHEKLLLEPGAIELSRTVAEEIPTLEPTLAHQPFAWMPLLLAGALVIGGVIAVAGIQAAGRRAPAPIVVEVRSSPGAQPTVTVGGVSQPVVPQVTPIPTPTPTPTPSAPITTPIVPEPGTPCALGMVAISSAHPYCIDLYEYPGGHTIPRTSISWTDAGLICQSRGLRLCSDAEWEQACRGPGASSFPYGSSYDPARCNTGGKSTVGAVLPAGEMPRCRSVAGAYDMSGNVAEWTQSGSQRGGSVLQAPPHGRCSNVVHTSDTRGAADVGFRCCGDAR